jgi:hypothetical protein
MKHPTNFSCFLAFGGRPFDFAIFSVSGTYHKKKADPKSGFPEQSTGRPKKLIVYKST